MMESKHKIITAIMVHRSTQADTLNEVTGYSSIVKPEISQHLHIMVLSTPDRDKAIRHARKMATALHIRFVGEWTNYNYNGPLPKPKPVYKKIKTRKKKR